MADVDFNYLESNGTISDPELININEGDSSCRVTQCEQKSGGKFVCRMPKTGRDCIKGTTAFFVKGDTALQYIATLKESLKAKNARLSTSLEDAAKQNEDLTAARKELATVTEQAAKSDAALLAAEDAVAKASAALLTATEKGTKNNAKIAELTASFEDAKKRVEGLLAENAALIAKGNVDSEQIATLQSQLKEAQDESADLSKQLTNTARFQSEKIAALMSSNSEQKEKIERLSEAVTDREKALALAAAKEEELNTKLQETLAAAKSIGETANAAQVSVNASLLAVQATYNKLRDAYISHLKRLQDQMKNRATGKPTFTNPDDEAFTKQKEAIDEIYKKINKLPEGNAINETSAEAAINEIISVDRTLNTYQEQDNLDFAAQAGGRRKKHRTHKRKVLKRKQTKKRRLQKRK
jgi:hypothetical protein